MKKQTITGRIYEMIFDILKENPEGVRWKDLQAQIEKQDPSLHPKTINGCIWKLMEKHPERVMKPEKGVFKLK